MNIQLRTVVLLAVTLVVLFLLGEINHYLAAWHVQLYLGGLLLTFPLLRLRFKQGLVFVSALGFFHDAVTAFPFGASLVAFLIAHTVVYSLRSHFHREAPTSGLAVAFVLNGTLILAFALIWMPDHTHKALYWQRILVDAMFSQLAVFFIAGWFFMLQNEALRFFGIFLDQEQRQAE